MTFANLQMLEAVAVHKTTRLRGKLRSDFDALMSSIIQTCAQPSLHQTVLRSYLLMVLAVLLMEYVAVVERKT